jgi:hypothetical protein
VLGWSSPLANKEITARLNLLVWDPRSDGRKPGGRVSGEIRRTQILYLLIRRSVRYLVSAPLSMPAGQGSFFVRSEQPNPGPDQ